MNVLPQDIRLPPWMYGTAPDVRRQARNIAKKYSQGASWDDIESEQPSVPFVELGPHIYLESVPILLPNGAEVFRPYLFAQELVAAAKKIDEKQGGGAKWLAEAISSGTRHFWMTLSSLCMLEQLEQWLHFTQFSALRQLSRRLLRRFAYWLPELLACASKCRNRTKMLTDSPPSEAWSYTAVRFATLAGAKWTLEAYRRLGKNATRLLLECKVILPTRQRFKLAKRLR